MSKSVDSVFRSPVQADAAFLVVLAISMGLGFMGASLADAATMRLFRSSLAYPAEFSGSVISYFWVVGLGALAVWVYGPWTVFPLAVGKGLCYGFCAGCAIGAFGQAGLLGWFFLLFGDTGMLWALCWYCMRRLRLGKQRLLWDLAVVLALGAVLLCLDHFVLSPFVEQILF